MQDRAISPSPTAKAKSARRARSAKPLWRRIRGPLAQSRFVKNLIASVLARAIRFVTWTNPPVKGSHDLEAGIAKYTPAIAALWHGQHLLGPAVNPRRHRLVALFSRSPDAELNALVAEKLGFGTVRGSGGRDLRQNAKKGGAAALIALKKTIDSGCSVAMIADIPHGTPREAGLGIVMLARLAGRPIVPLAIATSRRKVLERTWDKTTINLPFGRRAVVIGEPVHVPADASDEALELKRREVTESLNAATREAYRLVDAHR